MSNKSKNVKKLTETSVDKKNGTKTKIKSVIKNVTAEESAKRTKRIVIISVSIVLALAIIFGAVLGIVNAVKNASYLMKLDRVGIDAGVASFLVSIYKYDFMVNLLESGIEAEDTEKFWSGKYGSGTYGDLFNYQATEYLKTVVSANALFDEYATLTKDDKYNIDFAVAEVLNRKASGSKQNFNKLTEGMGFDFKDFEKGSEMLYKMRVVFSTVFGESGSKMQTNYADYCERFYNGNYVRAKVLIIRTEDTYKLDDEGNIVKGDDGKYETRPLTDEEKKERGDYIARLDLAVEGIKNNSEISLNDFNNLLNEVAEKYSNENVVSAVANGYYFAEGSQYTEAFGLKNVVSEAFDIEVGEVYTNSPAAIMAEDDSEEEFAYRCYVYKMEKEDKAYKNSSLEHFFRDFNSLAAIALYEETVTRYNKNVEFKKKWSNLNPVSIPYNFDYRVNTFGS